MGGIVLESHIGRVAECLEQSIEADGTCGDVWTIGPRLPQNANVVALARWKVFLVVDAYDLVYLFGKWLCRIFTRLCTDIAHPKLARQVNQLGELGINRLAASGIRVNVIAIRLEGRYVHVVLCECVFDCLDLRVGRGIRIESAMAPRAQNHVGESSVLGELHVGRSEWSENPEFRLPFHVRLAAGARSRRFFRSGLGRLRLQRSGSSEGTDQGSTSHHRSVYCTAQRCRFQDSKDGLV